MTPHLAPPRNKGTSLEGVKAKATWLAGVSKKVNTLDENWAKGFFGYGYFVEDSEMDAPNYLKTAERKKVLSNIESLGLLSAAEKAGLSLSKLESLKLFSTAERLGLLSTLERLLVSDPAAISSISLPLFVASLGSFILIPDTNVALAIAKYGVAAVLGGSAVLFFALGFLLAALQEE
ncbi:hypothetical protein WJX75_001390 [Coccomyxa subellipsoidea]|uniref:Uncharacterized protein n=1 Tax=Coccomyxa subellipsoidea TaxID=248742 RepID=A0ABR2YHB6_9CHLO